MMAERENYGVEGIAHGRSIDDATAYRSMRCVCVIVSGQQRPDERLRSRRLSPAVLRA